MNLPEKPLTRPETADESIANMRQRIEEILASGDQKKISTLSRTVRTLTENAIDSEQVTKPSTDVIVHEQSIKEHLFRNILHAKNPIVMYEGNELIFANLAWEKITGYTFMEIQERRQSGEDITEIFYGYSKEELLRVQNKLTWALEQDAGYEDFICTLQTQEGELVSIAWKNKTYPGSISIREGSIDQVHSLRAAKEHYEFGEALLHEEMEKKDSYTAGHIKRVTDIAVLLAELSGYNSHQCKKMRIQAALHDKGKNSIDEEILKKLTNLTDAEKESMRAHAGNGVIIGINNKYPRDFIRAMPHHSFFYARWGIEELSWKNLIEDIENGEDVNPNLFNHIMGREIPEEARIVSIADVFDAVASRRLYEAEYLVAPIEDIIVYLEENILVSAGMITNSNDITLDSTKWRVAAEDEHGLSYCIYWKGQYMIPRIENPSVKIQFDPLLVQKFYTNGKLNEDIKNMLRKHDNAYMPEKIKEIHAHLTRLEQKFEDDKSTFTEVDDATYQRITKALAILQGYIRG